MTAHAKLSASGSAKWMACPGSVAAEEGLPDGSSEHSREGSAAHHVAEQVLVNGGYASDWIGEKIEDYDIEVSHAMADYVQQYVDYVKSLGGTQLYEQRVDFSHVVPDGFGTSDAIVMEGRTLHIVDLKYGKGVKVYAQDNSQALLYAVGVVNDFSYLFEFDKVQVTIVQPRLDHIDEWEVDVPTLEKFAAYAKVKAEEALMPNAPRNPGEKQCQWCKAKFQCPELKRKTESVLMADFDNMEEAPTIDKLTHEQMAEILKHKKLITSFLEAIEKYVFAKLEDGQPFPGYKLVEGRSNRKISDEEFAIRMLHQNGYKDEQIFKPATLKTITELEKLMGKKEFALTLGDVVVKPEGAPTLATEDDPRKPISIGATADDFE